MTMQSDIQYLSIAAHLTHLYHTPVTIREEKVSGVEVIAVYSHDHRSLLVMSKATGLMGTTAFCEACRQMVESNSREGRKLFTTEPWPL